MQLKKQIRKRTRPAQPAPKLKWKLVMAEAFDVAYHMRQQLPAERRNDP